MPIDPAELIAYNALNRPEDDTATGGGGRDPDVRPDFVQLAADDDLEVLSDNAGDTTQIVTVDGRDPSGAFVTATATVNGLGAVILAPATIFERVLSISMDSDALGNVTVRRSVAGATVFVIPIGERGSSLLFINAASSAAPVTRFDKFFWRNTDPALTLGSAEVQLTADPAARIRVATETSKDDTNTIANRLTVPSGVVFVDDSVVQAVPGDSLESDTDIGIWVEQALLASDAPIRDTFTHELAGTTP